MLKGLDISEWQGNLDFGLLKQNFDFIIARSSFGTARADATFFANRDGLRATGQLRGWYHYAYPNNNLPEAEAEFAFNTIGPMQDGEIFALDFEESFSNPPDWCYRFMNRFQQLSGYKPLLYANLNLINTNDWGGVIKQDYGLWLAAWDYNPDGVCPNTPWSTVAMRQYSNSILYAGKKIDGNVFYGDATTFQLYGYKKSVAPTVGVYYKGLDLTNQDSMKAAIDVWDAVVRQGQYVKADKYSADIQLLKTEIDVKNKNLDDANKAIQTVKDSYLVLQTDETLDEDKIKKLTTDLETVQKALEKAQTTAPPVNNPPSSNPNAQVPTIYNNWLAKILSAVANAIEGK